MSVLVVAGDWPRDTESTRSGLRGYCGRWGLGAGASSGLGRVVVAIAASCVEADVELGRGNLACEASVGALRGAGFLRGRLGASRPLGSF